MRAALQSCHHRKPPDAPPTPAIATKTFCPHRTCRQAQDAMVSSVRRTFSIARNDRPDLLQAHLVVAIPGGHIRHNHAIARREAADDFGSVSRTPPESHVEAPCFGAMVGNLKEWHCRIRVRLQLLRQISRISDALRFNRSVNRNTGMRAYGLPAVGLDVYTDGPVLRCWIDVHHLAWKFSVLHLQRRALMHLYFAGFGFSNVDA